MLEVKSSRLNYSGIRFGDVVESPSGDQYYVADMNTTGTKITLEKLEEEERVKPNFLNGRLL